MKESKNNKLALGTIVVILALSGLMSLCGCSVTVLKGDPISIENWVMAKERFQQDFAIAAGYDPEYIFTKADFPLDVWRRFPVEGGEPTYQRIQYSWDDYSATVDGYDTHIAYEQDKIDAEEETKEE